MTQQRTLLAFLMVFALISASFAGGYTAAVFMDRETVEVTVSATGFEESTADSTQFQTSGVGIAENETGENETAVNETAMNETTVNETTVNETTGNETIGNETAVNETTVNET
ncbi:MAG: hypothetical protein V5A38_14225, partial [Halolamina sp.]